MLIKSYLICTRPTLTISSNSVFLVAGGASDDFGRATVKKLLNEGARVIICDFPTKDLHIYGDDKAIFLPINIMNENDTKTLLQIIDDKFGKLNGLISCIDYQQLVPVFDFKNKEPHALREFAEIVNENILGPFNLMRLAIPVIARNIPLKVGGRGIIINMSNTAALQGDEGFCAYSASKAAVVGMTESVNSELKGIQIRCVSVITNAIHLNDVNEATEDVLDEPKKFANLVKTIIETPSMNSPIIRLEDYSSK